MTRYNAVNNSKKGENMMMKFVRTILAATVLFAVAVPVAYADVHLSIVEKEDLPSYDKDTEGNQTLESLQADRKYLAGHLAVFDTLIQERLRRQAWRDRCEAGADRISDFPKSTTCDEFLSKTTKQGLPFKKEGR